MKKKQETVEPTHRCGIEFAFKRFGGKYKARIMWQLTKGTMRYGELSRSVPEITTKMLTQVLRELEQDKIIIRKMFHEVPPKVEYSLSDTGKELVPFLEHLNNWGINQMRDKL